MIDPYRTDEDVRRLADGMFADLTDEHRALFLARWSELLDIVADAEPVGDLGPLPPAPSQLPPLPQFPELPQAVLTPRKVHNP